MQVPIDDGSIVTKNLAKVQLLLFGIVKLHTRDWKIF